MHMPHTAQIIIWDIVESRSLLRLCHATHDNTSVRWGGRHDDSVPGHFPFSIFNFQLFHTIWGRAIFNFQFSIFNFQFSIFPHAL